MKPNIKITVVFLFLWIAGMAGAVAKGVGGIDALRLDARPDHGMELVLSVVPSSYDVGSDGEIVIEPRLVSRDSVAIKSFRPIVIAGRNRMMRYRRGHRDLPENALLCEARSVTPVSYDDTLAYDARMEDCLLVLDMTASGCCGKPVGRAVVPAASVELADEMFSAPDFRLKAAADDGPKIIELHGSAFVDFRVNKTDIDPFYRRNVEELAKIIRTIDVVRENPDASIREISIKGFASPEGSYANNRRLAEGRTIALKDYVKEKSRLGDHVFRTSFEPEDWEGLRRFVVDSVSDNRDALLAVIDSALDPDAKDAALRKSFPVVYSRLLSDVYPSLRHSDYVVRYEIRQYTGIDDIRNAFALRPSNLSENELIMLIADCDPGGGEFMKVLDTGLDMFPDNPQLVYLKGVELANAGDFSDALPMLEKASGLGIAEADEAMRRIAGVSRKKEKVTYLDTTGNHNFFKQPK